MNDIAKVGLSCSRYYLSVAGFVLAMEGEKCRDASLPESVLPPISQEELEHAMIGDQPAKDFPIDVVRFFRGDCWNERMLNYVAEKINEKANKREIGEHTQKMLDYWNDLALCSCDQWDTEFFEFVENFLKEYGRKVGA